MYPRRGFNNRLFESVPTDDGGFADLIYAVIRWLITFVLNNWQS